MRNRILLVAAATVLAGVVLGLSLWVGQDDRQVGVAPPRPGAEGMADVPQWSRETGLAPRSIETFDRGTLIGPGGAAGGTYIFEDGKTILTYSRFTPQPGGTQVYHATDPAVRRMLADDRLLVIRSDTAEIVAPENRPRQGNFRGDVVVTVYDLDPVRAARSGLSDEDVVVRIFLDEVDFDIELGAIESTSDVLVTGPRVDFRGTGLSLIYNDLHDRLQSLVIQRGRSARFKLDDALPGAAEAAPADPPAPVAAAAPASAGGEPAPTPPRPEAVAAKPAVSPAPTPTPVTPPAEAGSAAVADFYRARFENDVHITGSPEQVDMVADYLDAVFALNEREPEPAAPAAEPASAGGQDRPSAQRPATSPRPDRPRAAPPATQRSVADEAPAPELTPSALVAFNLPPKPARQSMMPIAADDVILTWKGRMVVEPQLVPPADLSDADDVLLRLVGRPVRITTAAQETVLATEAEYQTGSRRIRARGSAAQPLIITSPRLGRLEGQGLQIDQVTGVGSVQGPGTLSADDGEQPLTAAWQDRLDLRFFVDGAGEQLDALQSASFVGPVRIADPRFVLEAADSLVVDLTPPGEQDQVLRKVQASGDVSLAAREDADRWLDIASEALVIDFTRDAEGEAYPTRIVARDDVTTSGPGMTLASDLLDVELEAPSDAAEAGDPAEADAGLLALRDAPVRKLVARQRVNVTLDDPAVTLMGDRLVAEGATGRVDLYGSPDRTTPARIEQQEAIIQGPHIVMLEDTQAMEVLGPGTFTAQLDAEDPQQRLSVVWAEGMRFNNTTGAARFDGGVTATTRGSDDVSTLTSQHLDLQFDPTEAEANEAATDASATRRLRQLTATDGVVFSNSAYGGPAGNRLQTRLTLNGSKLVFSHADRDGRRVELVEVPGAGTMLIEDYRLPDEDEPRSFGAGPVALTGQGKTLFLWSERLTLDADRSVATLLGDVQMIHEPADDASDLDLLQLDAQRLVADLGETGGMGGVLDEQRGDLDVQYIRADGAVRIIADDRTVLTDHLQYTAADDLVRLWAEPGRLVEVQSAGSATPMSAGEVQWNLKTNRFTLDQVRPGVIPVPR